MASRKPKVRAPAEAPLPVRDDAPAWLSRLALVLLIACLVVHALWTVAVRVTDMDLWWSMAAGRHILENGAIPDRDVLSYTHAGAPWFNGEWLSQVLYFAVYRAGGGEALALLKVAVILGVFLLAAWVGWRRSGSIVLAVAATTLAAYSCRGFFDIRAQLFLFLGTLVSLAILEAYRRGAREWVLAILPLVMVVWVNAHYSFLYGIGVLLLYAGCESAKTALGLPDRPLSRQRIVRLDVAAAVAVLATLLNPYGIQALIHPFTILGAEAPWREEIVEWLRPVLFVEEQHNPAAFGYLLVVQAIAAAGALAAARRRFDATDLLLVAVTAVMALSARRFIPLFALVSAPFLARNLSLVRLRWWSGRPVLASVRGAGAVAAGAAVLTGWLLLRGVPEARATFASGVFEGMIYADYFPRGATEFLRLNPLPGRVFHPYTWGGYLQFQLPGRQAFIDGRAHVVYPWAFYLESQTVEHGEATWEEVLDRWDVALIVWPSGFADGEVRDALDRFEESDRWLPVYDDGHSAVFAHVERGREWSAALSAASLAYPDLPGARLFQAQVYLDADAPEKARETLQAAARAFPEVRQALDNLAEGYAEAAEMQLDPVTTFDLGFYRELSGNPAGAATAFRQALDRGLTGARAAYARDALAGPRN